MSDFKSIARPKPVAALVDLGEGDSINLMFDANQVTPAWANNSAQANDVLAVARALEAVIVEWDVTDNGQPFPPTVDNLSRFPLTVAKALMEKVVEAALPGETEGNASSPSASAPLSATSEPESTSYPNGSGGSTLPTPSGSLSSS